MIVMEHSCRLNALRFLARSVSCLFVSQSFSAVNISSPFFFFFLSKHISIFLKEAVLWTGFAISSHYCELADHMPALFTQWHLKA